MLIRNVKAKLKQNSEACSVKEYEFPFKDLRIAVAKINGRYPDYGKVLNTECDEAYYVISGKGIVHTEKGDFEINKGDVFYFEKKNWYWVEGENLEVFLPTSPAWFFEQYKELK